MSLLGLFWAATASAASPQTLFLLTVGQASFTPESGWAGRNCVYLHNVINWAITQDGGSPVGSRCLPTGTDPAHEQQLIDQARSSHEFPLRIEMTQLIGGYIRLRIENWSRRDPSDFTSSEWKIQTTHSDGKPVSEEEKKIAIQKLMLNFFRFWLHPRNMKLQLLLAGLPDSQTVKLDSSGNFIDKKTGKPLDLDQAYASFEQESPVHMNFARAAWEMAAVLGVGDILYDFNGIHPGDNETPSILQALEWKFTSLRMVRMDDNQAYVNQGFHPFFGSVYYRLGRENGASPLQSYLFALAGSSVWEYLVETREVVSITDQVFTSCAGSVVGEVFHQFETYAERGQDTVATRILRGIFGFDSGYQRHFITTYDATKASEVDSEGFPADAWHQFDVSIGLAAVQEDLVPAGKLTDFSLSTELFNIPTYGKPGRSSGAAGSMPYSQFLLSAGLSGTQLEQFQLYAKLALKGYYKQNINKDSGGQLKGYSFFIGPSSAYELTYDGEPGPGGGAGIDDHFGIAHILGSTIDLSMYYKGFLVRATFDAFGDFAQVRSLSYLEKYPKSADESQMHDIKWILWRRGDYYSYGITTDERLSLKKGGWELGGKFEYHRFESIEGVDREQQLVTNDFHLSDRKSDSNLWLSYTFPGDRMKLTGGVLSRSWESQIPAYDLSTQDQAQELYGNISILF